MRAGGGRTPAARRTGRSRAAARRRRSGRPRARPARPARRGACAAARSPRCRTSSRGRCGSPSSSCHGRIEVTDGRLRGWRRGRSGGPTGPVRQRRISSRNSTATSWRTSTWSWSPSWMIVEPRGGIARSPRTITFSSASRGSPSSRTGWPSTASPERTGNCIVSAPSRLRITGSTSGTGIATSSRGDAAASARPARSSAPGGSSRAARRRTRPGRSSSPCGDPLGDRERREHDRRRAAQAGPAEDQPLRHREAVGDEQRRERPRDHGRDDRRSRCPRG